MEKKTCIFGKGVLLYLGTKNALLAQLDRASATDQKVRGSNPLQRAKKARPPLGVGLFWHAVRDSNYVRTCRWHVHEPVRTLVNTFISFPVSRKGKEMQANPNQRASRRRRDRRPGH